VLKVGRVAGGRYHAGGGMAWDGNGNLLIGTGDDTNPHGAPNNGYGALYWRDAGKDAQKSSSNTNDLRGKVLRIHPVDQPVNGKHYTIPSGNLFAEGTAKTRPEIYAMGARNPFRVAADPVNNWVFFGEVGPDANDASATRGRQGHDELNVVATAGNYGWPYCNGNNFAYNSMDYNADQTNGVPGAAFDCARPVNNSPNNTGLNELPPSRAPAVWYAGTNTSDWKEMGGGGETAMAGAVYRYNRANTSPTRFPPQYEGRLFFWDWNRQVYKWVSFDAQAKVKGMVDFPMANAKATLGSPISAEFGKDGSLYILRYSKSGYGDQGSTGALFKVDYTKPIEESCIPVSVARPGKALRAAGSVGGLNAFLLPVGAERIRLFDLSGKLIWSETRKGREGDLRIVPDAALSQGLLRAVID
jgi:cytochrome c